MPVQALRCPACGAAIQPPANLGQLLTCTYCSTPLQVERTGADIVLHVVGQVARSIENSGMQVQATIQEGTYVTQAELRRLQLTQELSHVQLRLSHIQSEIRAIQRLPASKVTRAQMVELRAQERSLKEQMVTLQQALNPAPVAHTSTKPAAQESEQRSILKQIGWVFFSFKGRVSRRFYWLGTIIAFLLFTLALASAEPTTSAATTQPSELSCLATGILLLSMWIYCAVAAKRYHDRDKSGNMVLVILIPAIGFIWQLIELGFLPGTRGINQYDLVE